MFCYRCGQELIDTALFCHKCGTKAVSNDIEEKQQNSTKIENVQEQKPEPIKECKPEEHSIYENGKIYRICNSCEKIADSNHEFCSSCHEKLCTVDSPFNLEYTTYEDTTKRLIEIQKSFSADLDNDDLYLCIRALQYQINANKSNKPNKPNGNIDEIRNNIALTETISDEKPMFRYPIAVDLHLA